MHQVGTAGQFGEAAAVASERLYVVYNSATGEISHTHRVVTFEGGIEPSKEEVTQHAITLAQRRMTSPHQLEVLHVERGALKPGHRYRVDPESRVVVEEEKLA